MKTTSNNNLTKSTFSGQLTILKDYTITPNNLIQINGRSNNVSLLVTKRIIMEFALISYELNYLFYVILAENNKLKKLAINH